MDPMDPTWNVTALVSDDPVKQDLELHCDQCGEHLCDIEHGDSLGALVSVVNDHFQTAHGAVIPA